MNLESLLQGLTPRSTATLHGGLPLLASARPVAPCRARYRERWANASFACEQCAEFDRRGSRSSGAPEFGAAAANPWRTTASRRGPWRAAHRRWRVHRERRRYSGTPCTTRATKAVAKRSACSPVQCARPSVGRVRPAQPLAQRRPSTAGRLARGTVVVHHRPRGQAVRPFRAG